MFILGDESHHRGKIPWVTGALVAINVLMFAVQTFGGERFTNGFSLVPKEITELRDLTKKERVKIKVHEVDDYGIAHKHEEVFYINHYPGPFPIVLTLVTSMFLHGGLVHLIGNMWFLLVFGRNVECAMNHGRFLAFYTLCGVIGGLAHVASDPRSVIPCLGASGAISGVLGAYVAIHPLNKIKCWFGWWVGVIELPALVVIGVWFLMQYVSAFLLLEHPEYSDGTAYWDHVGGFVTGVIFIWATVLYLKYQQAQSAPESEEIAAQPAAATPAAAAPAPDPFGTFLPPAPATAIQAGEPKAKPATAITASYDPFASFVPEK